MLHRVLVSQGVSESGTTLLEDCGYEVRVYEGSTEEELQKAVADCDAALVRSEAYTAVVLEAAKRLKVVSRHGVGFNNIDVEAASRLGVYVTITPLANANAVAEHTIGLMIALTRRTMELDRALRAGEFDARDALRGCDLEGKTVGVVGMGRIGSRVARKAGAGLGMKLIGYDPYVPPESLDTSIRLVRDLDDLLRSSDFMTFHVPATKETYRMFGRNALEQVRSTAFLINTSRGSVVDEAALLEALRGRRLAGAALDVFDPEPPARDSGLYVMDNVILTPHVAGLTVEATERMAVDAAKEIIAVLSGGAPQWAVNDTVRA